MAEPQYTEKQVLALLRRAAEYQAGASSAAVDGLSADQVRAMALELGIAPEAIDMALRTGVEPESRHWMERFVGAPISEELDVVADGVVDADLWADYVFNLRKRFGITGTITAVGNSFEWMAANNELMGVNVAATAKGGRTRLRAATDGWGAAFLGTIIPAIAVLFSLIGIAGWEEAASSVRILLGLGVVGLVVFGVRRVLGEMFNRRHQAFVEAANEFGQLLAAPPSAAAPLSSTDEEPPLEQRLTN
jgi:hypothetical protein